MPRKQRVNFSLDPEVVELLDEEVPRGERSKAVEHALQEYLDGED